MNRRHALSLMAALPFAAARVEAQTRPSAKTRVILGPSHGFLLDPDGTLKGWCVQHRPNGAPWLGLGHDKPIDEYTLHEVPGLTNVVSAAAGAGFSCAVLADGKLVSWGWNSGSGMLGTTPLTQVEITASWGPHSNVPISIVAKFDAVAVSSQDYHVLALARDGGVYTWGTGKNGRLGIGPLPVIKFKTHGPGPMTYVPFPVRVPDLGDVVAISAGRTHSLALLKDGTVRAWGQNELGEVGDGTTVDRDRPVPVLNVRNAVAITAGVGLSYALLADGTVMKWGSADYQGPPAGPVPALLPGVRGIKAVAAGLAHGIALTESGTVMTWGDNTFWQLARGTPSTGNLAVVPGITGVQSIAAHAATTTVVLASGRILTWGGVREWTRPGAVRGTSVPGPSCCGSTDWISRERAPLNLSVR